MSERQIKAVMYTKEKWKITINEYQELCMVSKATATRDLKKLVQMGFLMQKGVTGKNTYYELIGSQRDQMPNENMHRKNIVSLEIKYI